MEEPEEPGGPAEELLLCTPGQELQYPIAEQLPQPDLQEAQELLDLLETLGALMHILALEAVQEEGDREDRPEAEAQEDQYG